MNERPPLWLFLDGAAAFSFSMLISLIIQSNQIFAEILVLRFIKDLTHQNDGLMAATMLLLFPSTAILYGSVKMIFAAKEAVEKKAIAKGREQGIAQGREQGIAQGREQGIEQGFEEGRRHILNALKRRGIELPPDFDNDLNGSGPRH